MSAKSIEHAIQSYMDRTGVSGGVPPYDSASLAEIYAPRVQELFELRAEGYVAAEWRDGHWHGVELEP